MSNHIAPSFEIKREKNDRKRCVITTDETHKPNTTCYLLNICYCCYTELVLLLCYFFFF